MYISDKFKMKKVLLALAGTTFFVMPVSAAEITSRIVDSVQLTVDGPAVQTTRIGSNYSVSGTNISASTLGGLNASQGSENHQPSNSGLLVLIPLLMLAKHFTFSESAIIGDVPITDQATLTNNGRFSEPVLYGESITNVGGTPGTLAGQLGDSHGGTKPQVTAGGPGTSAIGQRTVELSVFR